MQGGNAVAFQPWDREGSSCRHGAHAEQEQEQEQEQELTPHMDMDMDMDMPCTVDIGWTALPGEKEPEKSIAFQVEHGPPGTRPSSSSSSTVSFVHDVQNHRDRRNNSEREPRPAPPRRVPRSKKCDERGNGEDLTSGSPSPPRKAWS